MTPKPALLCLLLASSYLEGAVALYRTDPIDLHRSLRERYVSGLDVSSEVGAVVRATGDYSFDSLLEPSPTVRRALRLQSRAWEAWSGNDLDRAVQLYQDAARVLDNIEAPSERAFCYYYIAEIFSEQENYPESILWLDRAIRIADSRRRPYLQGLLLQSRGYSLWFMDHFQASVHAFTRALENWHEIGFREGMVTSWNNLASLYEELRLFRQADHCYQRALENLDESLDREIRFYLHLNYAAFSHLRKNSSQAEEHLGKASELQEVSPGKFLLLESRILGTRNRLAQLLSFRPQLPSLRIERALLLGEFFQQDGQSLKARNYLEEAFEEARESGLRYFIRASALQLGEWMEDAERYDEAARLYLSTLNSEYNVAIPEVVFPYWRAVSPLFDGWIRSLIRSGHSQEAWHQIQRLGRLRRDKGEKIIESTSPPGSQETEVGQFIEAGKREIRDQLPNPWEDLELGEALHPTLVQEGVQAPYTVLEIWPDGNRAFAWVIRSSNYVFRELEVPRGVAESIQDIVDPLYSARELLPRPPDPDDLHYLYHRLIEPLEEFSTHPTFCSWVTRNSSPFPWRCCSIRTTNTCWSATT